ncbi:MAG: TIGR03982 family His-Xaa-Ser system protein [Gammaproteobacteria bacterium]|nr:TIGR03982 family His-Xaa-Ser system protein [Gammaproteobacteria bacterium]
MFSTNLKKEIVKTYYETEYSNYVFKCDQVMREHFVAKQMVATSPNDDNVSLLVQAEIGLIDCQDYDLLRKKLLSYGLEESDLSEMGLKAIELKAKDIRKVVEIHEIRYD